MVSPNDSLRGGAFWVIDHDGLFKTLLSTFFPEFLELFAPDILTFGNVNAWTLTETELFHERHGPGKKRADLVARIPWIHDPTDHFFVHIEIQSHVQPNFSHRMFHYFLRLYGMHDAPIYPIALFTHDTRTRDEPSTVSVLVPGFEVARFRYRQVYLRKLDWRRYLERPHPVAAAFMAKMNYNKSERALVKAECTRMLAKLNLDMERTHLIGKFIEAYLPLDATEIAGYNQIMEGIPMQEKQQVAEILTYWEQLGIEKGLEQGVKQGIEQGRQEGRREGRREGILRMTLAAIKSRFGSISAEDRIAIERMPLETLEQLGLAALEAPSYAELRKRFLTSSN